MQEERNWSNDGAMKIRQNFIDNILCLCRRKFGSVRFEYTVKCMSMHNMRNVLVICMCLAFINFYGGHECTYNSWDKCTWNLLYSVMWFHLYLHAMHAVRIMYAMFVISNVMYVQIVTFMLKYLISMPKDWKYPIIKWDLYSTSSFDQTQMLLYNAIISAREISA